ncbi:MAG: type IV secretion system protein [Anaerolineae bacterium]|nr:type IV secretion system protein [Anaerolineae bacterium]MCL4722714.1 type IV secretion system protein [Rhodocyclaceae bacterium]
MSQNRDDRTPPGARREGLGNWIEAFEAPRAQSRRLAFVASAVSAVAILQGIAIWQMLPLKERIPYFVEADARSGEVRSSTSVAQIFKPDEKNLRFFLGRWTTNLLTIDTRSKEYLLPESYMYLRGAALAEWSEWVTKRDQPLKKLVENANYRREARVSSISLVADGVALVRVTLVGRTGASAAQEIRKLVTIHYSFVPAESEDDVLKNPLGLYITHFTISDELA